MVCKRVIYSRKRKGTKVNNNIIQRPHFIIMIKEQYELVHNIRKTLKYI